MAEVTKKDKILISNQVYQKIQPATDPVKETTGTIIYANRYAVGVNPTAMPEDYKQALNSDYGEVGNNILVQLRQKVQQFPDGPWYVDSKDGILYIHNRKLQEPSRATFEYAAGDGEVISVMFETQYIKKSIQGQTSTGISDNKGMSEEVVMMANPLAGKKIANDYIDFNKKTADLEGAIRDYEAGNTTYQQLEVLRERTKDNDMNTFTDKQWSRVYKRLKEEKAAERQASSEDLQRRYQVYQARGIKAARMAEDEAVNYTLAHANLENDWQAFLIRKFGSPEAAASKQAEMDMRAKNGTLESYLKANFSDDEYVFSKDAKLWWDPSLNEGKGDYVRGAKVEAYTVTQFVGDHVSIDEVNRSGRQIAVKDHLNNNGTLDVFTKTAVTTHPVSGYRLAMAIYSRKSRDIAMEQRVLAAANTMRSIIEKKLLARITVLGRPSLATSQVITINNVGKKWSGTWYIKQCIHQVSPSSGYTTQLDLVRHKAVEGYTAGTQSGGHTITKDVSANKTESKDITNINLTTEESSYFNSRNNASEKEELIVLKYAGVENAVSQVSKQTGWVLGEGYGVKNTITLRRKPTAEEWAKYGKQAAEAIAKGIKAK